MPDDPEPGRRELLQAAPACAAATSAPPAISRRGVVAGALALAAPPLAAAQGQGVPAVAYDLPPLPYGYDALEPVIDAETMELHHAKHHRAYVDALNKALEPYPDLQGKSVEALLSDPGAVPEAIRQTVRNQGGGHANHQMFWKIVQPGGAKAPSGAIARAIDEAFGSLDGFEARFEEAGAKHFGSGWVFLVTNPGGQGLEILTLPNQDSVLPLRKPALLANDLWEHAYYLKHRNRRADYLKAWWQVVNWTTVGDRLDAIRAGQEERLGGPAR